MPFLILIVVLFAVGYLCLRAAKAIDKVWAKRTSEIVAKYRPSILFCRSQYIGFQFEERRLVIGDLANEHEYDFSQMTKVELVRDDVPVVTTNRGSQIAGALVGGALLGVPGAVVGGLTGSKSTTVKIKNVSLKVYVDDPDFPVHTVCFFAAPGQGQKEGRLIRKDLELAEKFYGLCLNALREAPSEMPQRLD
jgi:hypothetical protein